MDISKKLIQYKHHITKALIVLFLLFLLIYTVPRLLNIVAYFWPLFASTAVFLFLIAAFGGLSRLTTDHGHGENAEGILDYVAGTTDYTDITENYE